jgi:uncharacterized SAM-dependent methyltransferase
VKYVVGIDLSLLRALLNKPKNDVLEVIEDINIVLLLEAKAFNGNFEKDRRLNTYSKRYRYNSEVSVIHTHIKKGKAIPLQAVRVPGV